MRRILFSETDFASLPNPPAGFKYIGFDGPNFSEKDENGSTTPTGGGAGLTDITYSAISTAIDENALIPGSYYRIIDFKTCYDQPNYDIYKQPITTGNYKEGETYPIIVFAISENNISQDAWQEDFPKDKIRYEIGYETTEITGGTAYGRITERIDQWSNRTDYDHREILFKRYDTFVYNPNSPESGTISVANGVVSGIDTTFTNFSVGDVIAIPYFSEMFFKIDTIESNGTMSLTGSVWDVSANDIKYYSIDYTIESYYKNNVNSEDPNYMYEYTTFGEAIDNDGAFSNYIGDHSNGFINDGYGDFLLANNVFLDGVYSNNKFGNNCYNNTFDDDCTNNTIGNWFHNNITDDDFDGNQIGNDFRENIITSNFNNNRIGSDFNSNTLLGGSFYRNNIGNNFEDNVWTNSDFQNNEIGNQFNNNKIYNDFYNNDIGNGYNNNEIYSQFFRNLIGNGYNNNTIYSQFFENTIEHVFNGNTIGTDLTIGTYSFYSNQIGNQFENNTILDNFRDNRVGNDFVDNIIKVNFQYNNILNDFYNNTIYFDFSQNSILNGFNTNTIGGVDNLGLLFKNNQIMNNFKGNDIQGDFWSNQIKTDFKGNQIFEEFGHNNIGFGCVSNTFSGITTHNNIGDNFSFNTCYGIFSYNTIGTNFNNNDVQDGFGFGGASYQGNKIGNNFYDNTIGEYFYNNSITDNFYNNQIGNFFQWNEINTNINDTNFTLNYGNITGFTYTSGGTGGVTGGYVGLTGSVSGGPGSGAAFNVIVSGGTASSVTLNFTGSTSNQYSVNDTITILGTAIGGFTGVIDGFSSDAIGKSGATGTYTNIFAGGTGSGENASFDITVDYSGVIDIQLNSGGGGYLLNEPLVIPGEEFGGTGSSDISILVTDIYSDDIVVTVTDVTSASLFYDHYTKQIFERKLGDKRVLYYDEDDILNVDSIYISSGYIPIYSQALTFPITYVSFEFQCDGAYSNNGGSTSQTVNNVQELVTLFNAIFRQFGYFFDNNDVTIGLYIDPLLKEQYCPNGTYSIYVYVD